MPDFPTQMLTIEGMRGPQCIERITRVLGGVHGVRVMSVEVGKAEVLAEPTLEQALLDAVKAEGFTLTEVRPATC